MSDKSCGVKLSLALKEVIIPTLVTNFFDDGEGGELQQELHLYVSEKANDSEFASFYDFLHLFYRDEIKANFDGLIILTSNIIMSGYSKSREVIKRTAEKTCNTTINDPILAAKETTSITEELYRSYATYRIMELSLIAMSVFVNPLIEDISQKSDDYLTKPLAEIPLRYSFIVEAESEDSNQTPQGVSLN